MNFLEYYLQILIFTAAVPLGFGVAVYFCYRAFCSLVGCGRGKPILWFLHMILTPVREFAHLTAAIVTFHHVSDFCLLNPYDPEGEFGFVEHSYNRKNPVAVLGNFLFAILPAVFGLFLSGVIILACFRGVFGELSVSVAALVEAEAGFAEYAKLSLGFFPSMFRDATGGVFAKIVGCLLLLIISLGVYVSIDDLFGAFSGMTLYAALLFAFAGITALFDARTRRLIVTWLRTFATGLAALYLVVLIFAAAAIALGFLVFLYRTFFGEGERVGARLPAVRERDYDEDDD